MKIEVWSDFVCPFCYMGKRKLEMAIKDLPDRESITIEYKSYELAPDAELNPKEGYYDILAKKFGISVEEAKSSTASIIKQAEEVGLTYCFDTVQSTNTFDAHRLAKYATQYNKGNELTERILKAYFTDSEHIGNHETLVQLAGEVGLNEEQVSVMLETADYGKEVRADENLAKQIGVTGVPFFVFNGKYVISGAQPLSVFTNILEKVSEEENTSLQELQLDKLEARYCSGDDGGCEI